MADRLDPPLERRLTRGAPRTRAALLFASALLGAAGGRAETPVTTFPSEIPPTEWTALLEKYVDSRGLVGYARWKADAADRRRLAAYAGRLGERGGALSGDAKLAILINAYNAFIIETVLDRYPVDSIRSIGDAFTARTHRIGGALHSLDEIEHTAIGLGGYRAHAAMVCASRSCPPLDRRAWEASDLPAHLDARMRAWMARPDLWTFEPDRKTVRAPKYLDWYRADFEKAGIARMLAAYGPPRHRDWLARGDFRVVYLDYDWGLNDQAPPRSVRE